MLTGNVLEVARREDGLSSLSMSAILLVIDVKSDAFLSSSNCLLTLVMVR